MDAVNDKMAETKLKLDLPGYVHVASSAKASPKRNGLVFCRAGVAGSQQ